MTDVLIDLVFIVLGVILMVASGGEQPVAVIGLGWALYGTVALALDSRSVHLVNKRSRRG